MLPCYNEEEGLKKILQIKPSSIDEVIVVNQDDELLGIGKLKVPVSYVKAFSIGVAVNIRKGVNKSKI